MISPLVRDELDQSLAWWTRLYHQALDACGAESVVGETWEMHNFMGETVVQYQERGWLDCSCRDCRRVTGE